MNEGLFEYGIGMKLRTMGIPSIHDFFRAAMYNPVDSFFMDKYCIKNEHILVLFSLAAMTLFIAVIFISFGGKNIEFTYI